MNLHVIPNKLVAALALGFVAYAALTGWTPMAIAERIALGGALVILFIFTAPMLGIGGGVLKLIAVAFLWFGLWSGLSFVAVSMLSCALFGAIHNGVTGSRQPMPYLPFAALAAIVVGTPWAQTLSPLV